MKQQCSMSQKFLPPAYTIYTGFARSGGVSAVSHYSTSPGTDHINAALAGLSQTTIAPLQRVQNAVGARHFIYSPTALAACLLAHPVQTVLHYAFSFQRKVPGVFIRHRSDSECQQTASSPTIILIDRLRATTTSHQVRRTRLFSHWSVCMEQTTRRHSRGT